MIGLHRMIAEAGLKLEVMASKRSNGLLFLHFHAIFIVKMIVCVIDAARPLRRTST